jgi:diguanylate cyclase (GGDEF)-like protein/PAS domain S-box-containing protein
MQGNVQSAQFSMRRFAQALLLGNLAVLAILFMTVFFALSASRVAYTSRARQQAENLARTLSLSVGAEIKQIDNSLLSIVQQLNRSEKQSAPDMREVSGIIDEQRVLIPQVDAIQLTDADGTVLNGGVTPAVTIADRDYLRAVRNSPQQLVISEPLQTRINKQWGLILARAHVDASGRFRGVVFSNLSSAHFIDEFDDVAIGAHGAVTLRSGTLKLVARYSAGVTDPYAGIGTVNVSKELRSALAASADGGSFVSRTASDGFERINAYRRIQGSSLLLLVGIATDDFYTPWKEEVAEVTGLSALLEFVVIWLSLLIYKQNSRQVQSHHRIVRLAAEREALLDNELVGMVKLSDHAEVWHNKAFAALLGYGPGELAGQSPRLLYPDDASYEQVVRAYAELTENSHFRTQIQVLRKDGTLLWVDLSCAKLPDGESLWMMVDISRAKESETQARHLARHDALTGLANRSEFIDILKERLREAERIGRQVAVCYIDLDGFKAVNDKHGHQAGDRLLKEAAQRMTAAVRSGDVVARLGGDEFVAVLCDVLNDTEVPVALKRLIDGLAAPIAVRDGLEVAVSASIGVALYPRHAVQADQLLAFADDAMYRAKRAGKNRFAMHSQ